MLALFCSWVLFSECFTHNLDLKRAKIEPETLSFAFRIRFCMLNAAGKSQRANRLQTLTM